MCARFVKMEQYNLHIYRLSEGDDGVISGIVDCIDAPNPIAFSGLSGFWCAIRKLHKYEKIHNAMSSIKLMDDGI